MAMATIGACTCGCPDGPEQHLGNCEFYLRYWEHDQLARIGLRYEQLCATHPLSREPVDDLIGQVIRLTTSVLADGNVHDPAYLVRQYLNRVLPR